MPFQYIVRHGVTRFLGEFEGPDDQPYPRGAQVIVRSDRGQEVGQVLCEATPQAVALLGEPTRGRILRLLTEQDQAEIDRLHQAEQREFDLCQKFVEQRRLQMELVDVEHLFGGERIVFYFLAEKRVDFRELVKDLARECQTRIEMRQIGVRDEARMIGGYGSCGRPLCCTTWLQSFEPISIKMAKQQKLSLNPSKLSGMCGRLKCCLRYELPNGKGVKHGGCADEGGCGSCSNPTGPGGGCGSCGSGGCGSCH
jgi:cell fate regulator YaaT (PSP1 superfamily)